MSERRVRLTFEDNFSVGMRHAASATGGFRNAWIHLGNEKALRDATWEPHDWADYRPLARGGYIEPRNEP